MDIDKNTKTIGYKLTLQVVIKNILKALDSVVIPESLAVYRMTDSEKLNIKEINVFNINPENEIKEVLKSDFYKINLYKLNIKEGTNGVGFTNIIFYDNKNKTLPIGMDLSTKMIVDISKLHLSLVNEKSFKIANFENEENDFSKISIKDVQVFEYEVVDLENIDDE